MTEPTKKPARRRARKADGKFKGDDPTTPNVNEAWEPTEVVSALPKTKDYSVKPKVGPSGDAGRYSKKQSVRPTFGKVSSTSF